MPHGGGGVFGETSWNPLPSHTRPQQYSSLSPPLKSHTAPQRPTTPHNAPHLPTPPHNAPQRPTTPHNAPHRHRPTPPCTNAPADRDGRPRGQRRPALPVRTLLEAEAGGRWVPSEPSAGSPGRQLAPGCSPLRHPPLGPPQGRRRFPPTGGREHRR